MYSFNKYLSEDMFNEYFSYSIVYTIQTPLNAFHVPPNKIQSPYYGPWSLHDLDPFNLPKITSIFLFTPLFPTKSAT